jgi:hypothetical protein
MKAFQSNHKRNIRDLLTHLKNMDSIYNRKLISRFEYAELLDLAIDAIVFDEKDASDILVNFYCFLDDYNNNGGFNA